MGRGGQRERSTRPPSSSGCAGPARAGTRTPGCPRGCAAPPRRGTRDCHSAHTPRRQRGGEGLGWWHAFILFQPVGSFAYKPVS